MVQWRVLVQRRTLLKLVRARLLFRPIMYYFEAPVDRYEYEIEKWNAFLFWNESLKKNVATRHRSINACIIRGTFRNTFAKAMKKIFHYIRCQYCLHCPHLPKIKVPYACALIRLLSFLSVRPGVPVYCETLRDKLSFINCTVGLRHKLSAVSFPPFQMLPFSKAKVCRYYFFPLPSTYHPSHLHLHRPSPERLIK